MKRLKYAYKGKTALNIMGGPSIMKHNLDLNKIDKSKYVVFLESKALTPEFLNFKLKPDFFLMFFPEKCQSNAFQHNIYQSFLAGSNLEKLLRPEFVEEYRELKKNFRSYFETWRPTQGPHKKYRFKHGVVLRNSPFDLLPQLPDVPIIAQENYTPYPVESIGLKQPVHFFKNSVASGEFSFEKYYNPMEIDGKVVLNGYGHLNSAAISLFPIQRYMGFEKIYFIGMDMSMLGSMEYSGLFTFKSPEHFNVFFKKAVRIFNYRFVKNKHLFLRPPYEFESLKSIMSYDKIEFVNVYEPFEYALPLGGIRNISFQEFLNE